jgi:hypothetical protein
MRRALPAAGLFFLAPLVAEFLLGNLPVTLLPALVVLAPMYGGGALVVREIARRAGRGWPTLLVLGLAYAVFEEGFTTQTLFNPDYLKLGLHLLAPAHVAALGIGAWWTVFVLTLHTVWSIGVSIALAEALVPGRETTPWLGRGGLVATGALFAFGAVATTAVTLRGDPFVASAPQLTAAGLVVVALVVAAFRLSPAPPAPGARPAPSPWLVGAGALAAGSAFLLVPPAWGWWAVAAYLALDAAVVYSVLRGAGRTGWGRRHRLALAGGAALAYAWHAFPQRPVVPVSETVDLAGNVAFALGAVLLLVIAARRQAS